RMSAASAAAPAAKAAVADAAEAPTKKRLGKKKLLVIVAASALLLAVLGGGALWWMKKRAAALAAEEDAEAAELSQKSDHKDDKHGVPTFVPMDMFTVNLADREAERYAQIGITLELDDPKVADQLKAYLPAVRNNILMALAAKTSQDLLDREGKVKLAAEIRREAARGLGIEFPNDEAPAAKPAATASAAAGTASAAKTAAPASAAASAANKKALKKPEVYNPITRVHFSNFIIQ
ncbi:MAG TPA: flagellar basal body-associated FliL family protein, partial [Burkholderiaceae bacterium]